MYIKIIKSTVYICKESQAKILATLDYYMAAEIYAMRIADFLNCAVYRGENFSKCIRKVK